MNYYPLSAWTLKKEPQGLLANYLDSFSSYLKQQGFCRKYIGSQLRIVASFSIWLSCQKVILSSLCEKHVDDFLSSTNDKRATHNGMYASLRRIITYLRDLGICLKPSIMVEQSEVQKVVTSFGEYLTSEKNLSPKTFVQYEPFITRLLKEVFPDQKIHLSKLSGKDVIEFISREAARLSVARAKVATNSLRSFIRYGAHCGEMNITLISAVPMVASWRMTNIPRAISTSDVKEVLSQCPRNSPIGYRDYAILQLLVHLGLRSNEIVSLTLDCIDWEAGTLSIHGKLSKTTTLPLPAEVGSAIADYLLYGRAAIETRALFIRTMAPFGPLGAQQTIGTIVRAAIERTDTSPPTRGAHQFRHALACSMLKQGASLTEIGSILRHENPKTTNIYAKIDIESLCEITKPWLGDTV